MIIKPHFSAVGHNKEIQKEVLEIEILFK